MPQELSAAVAAEVRQLLAEHRLTGSELARRIGQSTNSVATKLRGEARLHLDDLAAIGEVCGVTVAYIVARAEAALLHPRE